MDIKDIEEIIKESGFSFGLYAPPRLQYVDETTMRIVGSNEITHFGESLLRFANIIEAKTKESCK